MELYLGTDGCDGFMDPIVGQNTEVADLWHMHLRGEDDGKSMKGYSRK